MNFRRHTLLAILSIAILFNACTVKKRTYQNGYYVDWAFKKQPKKGVSNENSQTELTLGSKTETKNDSNKNDDTQTNTASSLNNESKFLSKKNQPTLAIQDTCGDVMTFKNGDELIVKVLEINEETIKYKRCDNIDGPSYTVGKEKIYAIKYSNGNKEIIEPPPIKKTIQSTKSESKEYPSDLIFAVILPFILSGIGVIIGIHFAIKAKRKILAYPDKYKGLKLAKFMLAFDIIILVAAITLILLLYNAIDLTVFVYIMLATLLAILIAAIYYASS